MGERPADNFPESLPAFQRMFPTDVASKERKAL